MLVDDYFRQLEAIIENCGSIRNQVVHKDKRSGYVGYFRADLYFGSGSRLHVREFVFTRSVIVKDTYAYHYQDAQEQLVFRYDNTQHSADLEDPPHHKHTSTAIVSSTEPNLQTVLDEILDLL